MKNRDRNNREKRGQQPGVRQIEGGIEEGREMRAR
jgi:hypothetical protein